MARPFSAICPYHRHGTLLADYPPPHAPRATGKFRRGAPGHRFRRSRISASSSISGAGFGAAVGFSASFFCSVAKPLIAMNSTKAMIRKLMRMVRKLPQASTAALLERRPDIAASERLMAAANAQIGVFVAAFYPNITLTGDYGTSALTLNRLLATTSRFWAFGSTLVQTVFDAGARSAQVEEARAVFDQDVANYRQTVLTAFQQVEDQLAALRIFAQEAEVQDKAVAAAFEAARILNNQYLAGTVAFTSVIVADQTALANAETAVNIRQSRLVASAALIQALGGGWDAAQLPSRDRIEEDAPLNFSPLPPPIPEVSAR